MLARSPIRRLWKRIVRCASWCCSGQHLRPCMKGLLLDVGFSVSLDMTTMGRSEAAPLKRKAVDYALGTCCI